MSENNNAHPNNDHKGGLRSRGRGGQVQERTKNEDNSIYKSNWEEQIDDFEQLGLKQNLLERIFAYGLKSPSKIQSLAIKPISLGRNVIAQTPYREGKTLTLIIGILQRINTEIDKTQALVIVPSIELADYIYYLFTEISSKMHEIRTFSFKDNNSQEIREAPHIAISTPKNALRIIKNGILNTDNLKILCLDEADTLLNGEFISQTSEIFAILNGIEQTLMFSSLITPDIYAQMERFMLDPVKIFNEPERPSMIKIMQYFVDIDSSKDKIPVLLDIYGQFAIQKSVIFMTKKETEISTEMALKMAGFEIRSIHDGMDEERRAEFLQQFKAGSARILTATDTVPRGVDIPQISLIVNLELPNSNEDYFRRVKLANSVIKKSVVINIVNSSEMKQMKEIQKFYHTKIEPLPSDFSEINNYINGINTNDE